MIETELNVNFFPQVIVTHPPITNGKGTKKNVSDGLISKEDRGKRIKLELIKILSEKTQSTEVERYLTHQLTDAEIMSFDILDW